MPETKQEAWACCVGWSERARGSTCSSVSRNTNWHHSSEALPAQPRLLLCSWQVPLRPQAIVLATWVHEKRRACAACDPWLNMSGAVDGSSSGHPANGSQLQAARALLSLSIWFAPPTSARAVSTCHMPAHVAALLPRHLPLSAGHLAERVQGTERGAQKFCFREFCIFEGMAVITTSRAFICPNPSSI